MDIRPYEASDCEETRNLFKETICQINSCDYDSNQIKAWIEGASNEEDWQIRRLQDLTLVAMENKQLVGFAQMNQVGYLDMLYVHKDYQNKGIATKLLKEIKKYIPNKSYQTHASITAKPFFEQQGFVIIHENEVKLRGQVLKNFLMEYTE